MDGLMIKYVDVAEVYDTPILYHCIENPRTGQYIACTEADAEYIGEFDLPYRISSLHIQEGMSLVAWLLHQGMNTAYNITLFKEDNEQWT